MECHVTTKSLKINLKRNIGTVLIIVEGAHDEFELFKQIFRKILHYNYIEKSRNQQNFKNYDEFVMKGNENSRVIVINSKNSNISTIKKDQNYLNEIYKSLYTEYGIDIKNLNVYFVWDRDRESNPKKITRELLSKLGNSTNNIDGEMNGVLLLSYPSVESYVISAFDDKTTIIKNNDLKKYLTDSGYKISKINRYSLVKAVSKMNKALLELEIYNYDIDNLAPTFTKVFDSQEININNKKYYNLLSFISIILLDLNIITEREK